MSLKRALITGVTGQSGSYLAELLLAKDYRVFGLVRRTDSVSLWRIAHILESIELIPGDLTDQTSLQRALKLSEPDEIYNLAAQSFVASSFTAPLHTSDVTGLGALRLFEAARLVAPEARIYQASSSEQYGQVKHSPQTEDTPFHPASPYGAAKTFAHFCAQVYRQAYGMFIVCGIAFNHESPRRGEEFVTRKITKAVAAIKRGEQSVLRLGDLTPARDWSHAQDIMRGAMAALHHAVPEDYVLSSGVAHSVREFVEVAFNHAGLEWQKYVKIDPAFQRPLDIARLCGCSEKARQVLGWVPSVSFVQLVQEMVEHDLANHPVADYSRRAGG